MTDDTDPVLKHATFDQLLNELAERCRTMVVCYCVQDLKPPEDFELNWFKSGPIWEMRALLDYLSVQVNARMSETFAPPSANSDDDPPRAA